MDKEFILPFIVFVLSSLYMYFVALFGVIVIFGPMFMVMMFLFYTPFIFGIYAIVKGCKKKGLKKKVLYVGIGLLITLSPLFNAWGARNVNEYAIERKFRKYDSQLSAMCKKIVKEEAPHKFIPLNKYREFDIWLPVIGPVRNFASHDKGIVYIDFAADVGTHSGVLYNPENKQIREDDNSDISDEGYSRKIHHMFGPWYRYVFSF